MGGTGMIEPTRRSDLSELASTLPESEAVLLHSLHDNVTEEALSRQFSTCRAGGELIAIGGVLPMLDDGYLTAFAFLGKRALEHKLTLTKWAKRCMEVVEVRFAPRRLEISTMESEPSHREWAEVLGFEAEGRMRGYFADGGTAWRMAKVWQ